MKIIINSRKYKLPTQYEMLDLGMPDEFESNDEVLEALERLDKIVKEYIAKLDYDPYKDKEFKPKKGTNSSLSENWEWVEKKEEVPF